jgi:hypothetical protein
MVVTCATEKTDSNNRIFSLMPVLNYQRASLIAKNSLMNGMVPNLEVDRSQFGVHGSSRSQKWQLAAPRFSKYR